MSSCHDPAKEQVMESNVVHIIEGLVVLYTRACARGDTAAMERYERMCKDRVKTFDQMYC